MSKWLEFSKAGTSESGKTIVWWLYSSKEDNIHTGLHLGEIRWRGAWRKYAFFPEPDTVFEQDCLRDIAQFCEDKTREHKEAKKK